MPPKNVDAAEVLSDQETSNQAKENASLKRAREGSQEPTPSPNPVALAPTKKNRLETTDEEPPTPTPKQGQISSSSAGSDVETGRVGEVRRKVQEMTYEEGAKGASEWEEIKDDEVKEAKANAEAGSEPLKRKTLQRNASSVIEGPEATKRSKDTPSPPVEESPKTATEPATAPTEPTPPTAAPAPAAPAKKAPTTFGSFSSSASPFAAARTSSPFASSSSTSTSNSKLLATGSAFGNYSSSFSAFAKKPPTVPQTAPATAAKSDEADEKAGTGGEGEAGSSKSKSTFGDILKESKADEGEAADKVQMTEKDVYTGEEGEETLYQCRAKLYVMQADGGWKERGVGALRLNVRAEDKKGPRLVMRAEGVLRLILNVSLYVGMSCLEDGKHVRSTVFEDNEKRFITFRLGSQKAAAELCATIQEHIPLESNKSPAPHAPSPAPASGGDAV